MSDPIVFKEHGCPVCGGDVMADESMEGGGLLRETPAPRIASNSLISWVGERRTGQMPYDVSVKYEVAIVSGGGFCRLRKLIPMIAMPHVGPSGPVTSNVPVYHRKVDIYEGTAQECVAMRDVLASNPERSGPTADAASKQDVAGSGPARC